MADIQAQLDALDRALASGAMRVKNANGEEVFYRSVSDMLRVRARLAADLAGTAAPRRSSGFYPRFSRFPCDPTG